METSKLKDFYYSETFNILDINDVSSECYKNEDGYYTDDVCLYIPVYGNLQMFPHYYTMKYIVKLPIGIKNPNEVAIKYFNHFIETINENQGNW